MNTSFFCLDFSFLYPPTLHPGAPISLLIILSLTTTFTTRTQNVTGIMTEVVQYLPLVVFQILAVWLF